jgi:hypothetical protein
MTEEQAASGGSRKGSAAKALLLVGAVIGAVAVIAGVIYRFLLRPWQLRWGATEDEASMALPGDELLERADLSATRGVSISVPPARVWPWLVQIGQDRAGFYSYDTLENLAGCEIHSADEIVEEWQHLEVGDAVRLHPEFALIVAQIDPGRALVLRGAGLPGEEEVPFNFTWAFVLRDEPDGGTRLLVRERYEYLHSAAGQLIEPVSLASFVMSRKMLQGIRERAERTAAIA